MKTEFEIRERIAFLNDYSRNLGQMVAKYMQKDGKVYEEVADDLYRELEKTYAEIKGLEWVLNEEDA